LIHVFVARSRRRDLGDQALWLARALFFISLPKLRRAAALCHPVAAMHNHTRQIVPDASGASGPPARLLSSARSKKKRHTDREDARMKGFAWGFIRTLAVSLGLSTLIVAAASLPAAAQKKYDPGVTDTEIKIGNIMPYSGPASDDQRQWRRERAQDQFHFL
jgi:hypothetical protein